jgi:hypothetical protein
MVAEFDSAIFLCSFSEAVIDRCPAPMALRSEGVLFDLFILVILDHHVQG